MGIHWYSTVPTLYVGRVEDLLCRVPLIPCFLDGNATSPIPFKYCSKQNSHRRTLLSAAVQKVLALTSGGAAKFTRSTPGCGTLDSPSLAWAATCGQKLRSSNTNTWDIHDIYQVYTWYIIYIY
jgi:hypothetical protein